MTPREIDDALVPIQDQVVDLADGFEGDPDHDRLLARLNFLLKDIRALRQVLQAT